MKREVWVDMPEAEEHLATVYVIVHGIRKPVRRETIHESKWIPASKPPTITGWYPVLLGDKDFKREWSHFESKYCEWETYYEGKVTWWLDAHFEPETNK